MGLGDVQNINARTLDTQAVFQQAISASDMALRQAEKNLAAERSRQASQISSGEQSSAGSDASLNLEKRVSAEKLKRYRLVFNGLNGQTLEIEENYAQPRPRRLDLNA